MAEIDPLLVTYNSAGAVEGVKYDRIGVVLIDVIRRQQVEISSMKARLAETKSKLDPLREGLRSSNERLEAQEREINALRAIICMDKPSEMICRQ